MAAASATRSPSSTRPTLSERTKLSMTPGEQGIGLHEVIGCTTGRGAWPKRSRRLGLVEGHTVCPRQAIPDECRPASETWRGARSPAPAGRPHRGCGERQGTLSGSVSLVIRAHTAKWFDNCQETRPSRRGSSRISARASASRRHARIRPKRQTSGVPYTGEAEDRWPAGACRAARQVRKSTERLLKHSSRLRGAPSAP